MSKTDEIRNSREYRIIKAQHLRNNPRCIICGAIKGRVVHHKNNMSYFPELTCDLENLVTLCDYRAKDCHGLFHITMMGSYRKKCTEKDFENFIKIINFKEIIDE